MNKPAIALLGIALIAIIGIAVVLGNPENSNSVTPGQGSEIVQMEGTQNQSGPIAELPEGIREKVLDAVAEQSGEERSQFEIVAAQRRSWPDGCLGLTEPGSFCTQIVVSGWEVTVSKAKETWVYRTDRNGSQVMLDTAASSGYK
ncbi:hypothetical protein [Laspinema olomoucense]|uniref:hypothetical protein n=1 Tax=Laspinema olomoucense TaxID=3231600 RepID=UPI0021BB54E3|nr:MULTISPECIES: hypothetical protein [unclassified Laspinema]MCT7975269.1 hypothetical protein [Laspinema sp. D3d]MCT7991120.1 hypothetical protein [Laspinema sp. D3a]